MQKPQYELVPLKAAVMQCQTNIDAFRKGIAAEENRIVELRGYIQQWEEYNKGQSHHGDNLRQSK